MASLTLTSGRQITLLIRCGGPKRRTETKGNVSPLVGRTVRAVRSPRASAEPRRVFSPQRTGGCKLPQREAAFTFSTSGYFARRLPAIGETRISPPTSVSRMRAKEAARRLRAQTHAGTGTAPQARHWPFWPKADARAVPCTLHCSPGPGRGRVWPCSYRKSPSPRPQPAGALHTRLS